MLGHAVDVTDRRQLELFLRQRAFTDSLTQAANRALFEDRLRLAIEQANRRGRSSMRIPPLAVVFLDLDGFKAVNDRFGHAAGDAVLRQVAARLRASVRLVDTVARLGGDEFAVLLPDVGPAENVRPLVEKLIASLRQPFVYDGSPLAITFSLGVSTFPEHGESAETLAIHADAAMYAANQAGKNQYRFFDE